MSLARIGGGDRVKGLGIVTGLPDGKEGITASGLMGTSLSAAE